MRRKDSDLGAQAALEILDECEYATISHVYYADEIDARKQREIDFKLLCKRYRGYYNSKFS